MRDSRPKKLLIIDILHILQRYSDAEHPLTQQRILELLYKEYETEIERKTLRSNLRMLMNFGFPISCFEDRKRNPHTDQYGEEVPYTTGWYYDHAFSNGELRFLIDNVLFFSALPQNHRHDLIQKLEGLSGCHFRSVTKMIDMNVYSGLENWEILLTVEILGAAIADGKQVSFSYNDCGTDCELHPRLNPDGSTKRYTVNPYQLVTANGHAYLICNLPQYDDLTHFRLDRITDIQPQETAAKPLRKLRGFAAGLRLSEYLRKHPDLWSGDAVQTAFRCGQNMMNDVIDRFGRDIRIEPLPDNMMTVYVRVTESAMLHWALQFTDAVEVISPVHLRKQIADALRNAMKKYE